MVYFIERKLVNEEKKVMRLLDISAYIQLTDDIISEVLTLSVCERYKQLQQKMNKDSEIKQLISDFAQVKAVYNDVQKYGGKYHPDYKQVTSNLIKAKTALFEHPDVKEFKECEKEVQQLLDQIASCMRNVIKFDHEVTDSSLGCKGGCSR